MSKAGPRSPSRSARAVSRQASTPPKIASALCPPDASSSPTIVPPQVDDSTTRLATLERELERARRRADARGKEANALRQHVQELEPQVRRLGKELEKQKKVHKPIWHSPHRGQHGQVESSPTRTSTGDEAFEALRTRVEVAEQKAMILQLQCDQLERERAPETHTPVDIRNDHQEAESELNGCHERRVAVLQDLDAESIKKELEVAERRIRNSLYLKEAHENLAVHATAREREANGRAAELERRLKRTQEKLESKERRDTINGLRASCKSNEEALFIAERELRARQLDPELFLPVNTAKRRQLGRLEQRYNRLRQRYENQCVALVEAEKVERKHDDLRGAASSGEVEAMTKFLQSSVSVNVPDQAGLSAFHYACGQGNAELVRLMLDAGGDVLDGDGTMPGLIIAAGKGQVSVLKTLLLAGADVSTRDSAGGTPLHAATRRGQVEALRALLEAGSDINAVDHGRNTPLHTLASASIDKETASEIASLLLEWGASVDIKNFEGFNPVSAALEAKNRTLVLTYRDFLGEEHHLFPTKSTSTQSTPEESPAPEKTKTSLPPGGQVARAV